MIVYYQKQNVMVANSISKDNYISTEEVCQDFAWIILTEYAIELENNTNCSDLVILSDLNNDSVVSFYEVFVFLPETLSLSSEKSLQVDCSTCVGNGEYY